MSNSKLINDSDLRNSYSKSLLLVDVKFCFGFFQFFGWAETASIRTAIAKGLVVLARMKSGYGAVDV